MDNNVILRFDEVNFEYIEKKPVLSDASFSIRKGSKITLMGQNGAGKSTIFKLINGEIKPKSGKISIDQGSTIGIAKQVIEKKDFELTIEEYLKQTFIDELPYNYIVKVKESLEAVNLNLPLDKKIKDLSGGQQARLLLAYSLIQNPDILLLDEPTNNLDADGINHLIIFLIMYEKTVLVISHDADFLNSFTDGVIYLDIYTKRIEQYVGNYLDVCEQINKRIEKEQMQNARLVKQIKDRKEKANFFSHKGGNLRALAKKLREEAEEAEKNMVDVRREDRTIRDFIIPNQEDIGGVLLKINSLDIILNHELVNKKLDVPVEIYKRDKILMTGPNGIGKTTLLRSIANRSEKGIEFNDKIKIGYYTQNFSNLNYDQIVFESLKDSLQQGMDEYDLRSVAAGFLLTGEFMGKKIGDLSEGQKGLLTFTKLVLEEPGLLILDEPTNHINFRHIPVIAEAINDFQGGLIIVSHMEDFVKQINITRKFDLTKI